MLYKWIKNLWDHILAFSILYKMFKHFYITKKWFTNMQNIDLPIKKKNEACLFTLLLCKCWALTHIHFVNSVGQEEQEKHWNGLQQYFGVNDRFDPPACSVPPPKVTKTPAYQFICRALAPCPWLPIITTTVYACVFVSHCLLLLLYVTRHMD